MLAIAAMNVHAFSGDTPLRHLPDFVSALLGAALVATLISSDGD